jgi:putative DNA primase/helicase
MSDHLDHKREGAPRQESALEKRPDGSISKNSFELKQADTALADIQTERALISCLLSDTADVLPIIKESSLSPSHFSDKRNSEILGRVLQAEAESESLDAMSVFRYLVAKGIPLGDLSELTGEASVGTAAGIIKHWCGRIKEAAGSRRTASAFERLSERLKSGEKLEPVLAEAEECINTTKRQLGPIKTRKAELLAQFEQSSVPSNKLSEIGIPPRRAIVDDWLCSADYGLVFAQRGVGKTWYGLALACAVSSAKRFGPYPVHENIPALYIDGEMPLETIRERIKGLGGNSENLTVLNHEALFHNSGCNLNLTDREAQDAITELCIKKAIKLLVLDNLSCLFSGVSENEADAWEPVNIWLLDLRRRGIAVVLVLHSGRDPKGPRGTSRREDQAFWAIRLEEVYEEAGEKNGARFIPVFTKNRNSPTGERPMEWTFKTMTDGSVEIATKPADRRSLMIELVRNGLKKCGDIAEEMNLSKGQVSKMATELEKAGRLKIAGREYALP